VLRIGNGNRSGLALTFNQLEFKTMITNHLNAATSVAMGHTGTPKGHRPRWRQAVGLLIVLAGAVISLASLVNGMGP
jgi:hypothetical protein